MYKYILDVLTYIIFIDAHSDFESIFVPLYIFFKERNKKKGKKRRKQNKKFLRYSERKLTLPTRI